MIPTVCLLSLFTAIFVLAVQNGLINLVYGEILLYTGCTIVVFFFWSNADTLIRNTVKPFLNEDKRNKLEKVKKERISSKRKTFILLSSDQVLALFILLFSCYYTYIIAIIFRSSSNFMKGTISIFIHPICFEVLLFFLYL